MKYGLGYALITSITGFLSRTIFYFRRTELNYILNLIKNDDSKILDFGCNTGYFANMIKKRNPKSEVYGADINKFALNYARKRYKDIQFFNINERFYKNYKFDIIVLSHVLEHVKNPKKLIKNISKLLNKNGLLIIAIPQERIRGDTTIFQLLYNLLLLRFENPHVIKLNYEDCNNILTKSRFAILDHIYTNYFLPFETNIKKFYSWSLIITARKMN